MPAQVYCSSLSPAAVHRRAAISQVRGLGQPRPAADGSPGGTHASAGRTPTKADWALLSRSWRGLLGARIEELETLQTRLTSCIGCGCLSLKTCSLLNADDRAAGRGSGARYLLGDSPDEQG